MAPKKKSGKKMKSSSPQSIHSTKKVVQATKKLDSEVKMKIDDLPTYQQILEDLGKKGRLIHLLFGNGFSMAYDKNIFSYNALSTFIENIDDPL
jgi:hypothetical protein